MVEAVARAARVPADAVRRAAMLAGDVVGPALAVLAGGASALDGFRLEVGRPVQPMLAQTADDPRSALAALGGAAHLDVKLDGARIQVHRRGDAVTVYTRALLPITAAVPEVVDVVRSLPVTEVVLDGEVLALRPDGRPHPFQVTMRRVGRKAEVAGLVEELPLTPFFFDLLHLDGETFLDRPLSARLDALARVVPGVWRVRSLVTDDPAAADAFLASALDQGHEGVMAKAPGSPYEAGSRGASWLKVKHAWTLDLVVLAAEWGSGRRRGTLSNLHLGARDPRTGGFVMLGKTFKGLTDEMLAWQTRELSTLETHREGHVVFVRPELVVEVAFNEVQASPRYPGGVALRFARVKAHRPDKRADEVDTIDEVRRIFAGASRTDLSAR
jgi:DNA ligase-1